MFFHSFVLLSLTALDFSAPAIIQRANPCFVTGTVPLSVEVATGLTALAQDVMCNAAVEVAPGVPEKSSSSPLAFALATFPTPASPATADLGKLQKQLNFILLWFQISRVDEAIGVAMGAADAEQLKMRASSKEVAQLIALATVI
ncbi:hypothetical protein FPV67DRAFT_1563553 [Lyophyllum atratum]|nr:hypothetical protein FPV67DRAFT_1563553 [Lyophyllum atratum]